MISHAHKCIFIHQRKCAGMSIMAAFGIDPGDTEWHFMNNGTLSPEYKSAPAGYFTFSVVRNPWDRFISGWKYCKSTKHRSLRDVLLNMPQDGHDYRHITRPQHAILHDESGKLVVDYLMRFESLQKDFDHACDILGMRRQNLSHVNKGHRSHYRLYFDAESRAMFREMYRKDIDVFGYDY